MSVVLDARRSRRPLYFIFMVTASGGSAFCGVVKADSTEEAVCIAQNAWGMGTGYIPLSFLEGAAALDEYLRGGDNGGQTGV